MTTHRCTSPSCEDAADQAVAFCFRHASMVPTRELEVLNKAWRAMNRIGSEAAVSRFYKVRQQALDASPAMMTGRSVGDASGPFRRLFGLLTPEKRAAQGHTGESTGNEYKGDIASVSRAQDVSFGRNTEFMSQVEEKPTLHQPPNG